MAAQMQTFCGSRVAVARPMRAVVARAADRTMWLPSMAKAPAHLDGSMAGDFGFDPLGLGAQGADRLKWFAEAEKTNGRWAMMAVAGILFTEAMGVCPKWFEAGAQEYNFPFLPLLAIEFVIMGFLETKRYKGFKETGSSGLINQFPFDPASMNSGDMAVKEVKNGRLAMVAFAGFMVQALVTRQGPIACLTSHMSNPFGENITTTVLNLPNVV